MLVLALEGYPAHIFSLHPPSDTLTEVEVDVDGMGLVIFALQSIETVLGVADVEGCADDTLGNPDVAKEDGC